MRLVDLLLGGERGVEHRRIRRRRERLSSGTAMTISPVSGDEARNDDGALSARVDPLPCRSGGRAPARRAEVEPMSLLFGVALTGRAHATTRSPSPAGNALEAPALLDAASSFSMRSVTLTATNGDRRRRARATSTEDAWRARARASRALPRDVSSESAAPRASVAGESSARPGVTSIDGAARPSPRTSSPQPRTCRGRHGTRTPCDARPSCRSKAGPRETALASRARAEAAGAGASLVCARVARARGRQREASPPSDRTHAGRATIWP